MSGDEVTLVDGSVADTSTKEERARAPVVFKDFEFAPSGKLVSWTSQPGGPLAPRMLAQWASETVDEVTVQLKTSYVSNPGPLVITYEVRNGS